LATPFRKEGAKPPAIKRCELGRPGTRYAGFGRFEVVLAGRCGIAEIDERRLALTSLGAKSALENHGEGLASPRESIGEANQRRKPERGGKAVRSVAGSGVPKGMLEHSAMEGALGRESRSR